MKVTVYSAIKHETSSRILPEVFSVIDANPRAVAIAMRVYRANDRQGTAKTKTRGEVTMTGKKVYKQKGTGGARHGSRRAPIFVGGGVTFGPHGNQNWSLSLPRRQRLRSLQQAFGLRSSQTSMMIDLVLAKGKTSVFAKAFDRIDATARTIVMVLAPTERNVSQGLRNLERVHVCYADQLNSHDIIRADKIVLSEMAVDTIVKRFLQVKPLESAPVLKSIAPAELTKSTARVQTVAITTAKKTTVKKTPVKKSPVKKKTITKTKPT